MTQVTPTENLVINSEIGFRDGAFMTTVKPQIEGQCLQSVNGRNGCVSMPAPLFEACDFIGQGNFDDLFNAYWSNTKLVEKIYCY